MNERLSIEQGMLLYERKMNYILLLIKTISRVIIHLGTLWVQQYMNKVNIMKNVSNDTVLKNEIDV